MSRTTQAPRRIVVIGGGTGAPNILKGLKRLPNVDLTGVITTVDNGGSTGSVREWGNMPAPGDIRRALAALTPNEAMAKFFDHRLRNGHPVGNLALYYRTNARGGNFDLAVQDIAERLQITGRVVPASVGVADLVLHHGNERVVGEHTIGNFPVTDPKARVSLTPDARIHPDAEEAIENADIIIAASGSRLTSAGAALAAKGTSEAIGRSKAQLVSIANLTPTSEEPGDPGDWHVANHVASLEEYTGRPFDVVMYHDGGLPDGFTGLSTEPSGFEAITARLIGAPMAARTESGGLIHNPDIIAAHIDGLLESRYAAPQYA